VNPPRNARPDPTLIFCEYPKCSDNKLAIPLHLLPHLTERHTNLHSTPHSGRHSYAPSQLICLAPGCSSPGTFKTKQALTRHYQSKHLNDRHDCPVAGCLYVGDRGIKRADNLAAHLLTKHGISRAKPGYGN